MRVNCVNTLRSDLTAEMLSAIHITCSNRNGSQISNPTQISVRTPAHAISICCPELPSFFRKLIVQDAR